MVASVEGHFPRVNLHRLQLSEYDTKYQNSDLPWEVSMSPSRKSLQEYELEYLRFQQWLLSWKLLSLALAFPVTIVSHSYSATCDKHKYPGRVVPCGVNV